ncbi:MAG: DUF4912 domain-containing protein [Bacillota bacterium]
MGEVSREFKIPERYNENYLVLLVRNPYCLFAYWELTEEQRNLITKEFGCEWGGVPLILRLYDVTGLNFDGRNAHSFRDLSVHALADNFYLYELEANKGYCVDLGVITPDGRFVTILRSNVVTTPRDTLADGSVWEMADFLDREVKKPVVEINTISSAGYYEER